MQTTTAHRTHPDSLRWSTEIGSVRAHFGAGRLADLGGLARSLGGSKALLVSDGGVRSAGHLERAASSLRDAGLEVEVFDQVTSNPTTELVRAAAEHAAPLAVDLIVAVGGGSPMDCAKGINFLLTNGGEMRDYWGYGKATEPMLPAIAVPATAGTGSEAQSYALVSDAETGRKMACGDEGAFFRVAILDPEVSLSAPRGVAAAAGIDALSHALESFVTRTRTRTSMQLASEAWELLEGGLEEVLEGGSVEAHGRMLLGAHLAGAAIEASMLGAAHACANPLTARHGIPHGLAVGLMLPGVIRANAVSHGDRYTGLGSGDPEAIAARFEELRRIAEGPERLRDEGIEAAHLAELAAAAAEEWTAGHNPRPLTEEDLRGLYEAAL